MWVPQKSIDKTHGYTLVWQGKNCPSWAPCGWHGWWKYKRDSLHRAEVLNSATKKEN